MHSKIKLAIIAALFLVSLYFFWPGILRVDSIGQYEQAVMGTFNDHHPPIMAAFWRILNYIYQGPAPMLIFHLSLLWGAAAVFCMSYKKSAWSWFFVIIPLWPQVLCYAPFVLKDAGFALSFLLAAALLSHYTLQQKKPPLGLVVFILLLMFYGAAVKYQGIFLLPVLCLWLAGTFQAFKKIKTVFWGGLLFCFMFFNVETLNNSITNSKNYSWQYVKLYDLASISLQTNKNLFPNFILQYPNYSLSHVAQAFDSKRVDSLVWSDKPALIIGSNDLERQALLDTWWQVIQLYPKEYIQHRAQLITHLFQNSPIKSMSMVSSHQAYIPLTLRILLEYCETHGIIKFIQSITTFDIYLPWMLSYLFFGMFYFTKSPYAVVLTFLNGMGVLLLCVLSIFSMASDGRYIYLSMCCFHFSHPFFAKCLSFKSLKEVS